MTTNNTTYQQLAEVFPAEMQRILNKAGANLVYIPISEVITRLNKVLGVDRWSFTVEKCERDSIDPDFVIAHVRLAWNPMQEIEGKWMEQIVRDGIGGQKIKRTKAGAIVDLGDEFKGAISDALKKAAQTLGVGLYLARSDDAIETEQAMDSQVPRDLLWTDFVNISKSLSEKKREELALFWTSYSGGRPKPKSASDIDDQDMNALIVEATRLSFDGDYVIDTK